MAINKKLITFAKKDTFLGQAGINHATTATNGYYNNIPAHSIVFIKDTGEIWQNGTYYGRPLDSQITPESGVTDGIVIKTDGVYRLDRFSLWGNTFDGTDPSIDGDLLVKGKWEYGEAGIRYKSNGTFTPVLTLTENTKAITIASGPLAVNGGDFTVNQIGAQKFKVTQSTGDVLAAGDIQGLKVLNTPTYIAGTLTQGKTWIAIKQFENDTTGSARSLATNPPAYLTIQEGVHSADYNWKPWIADGDITNKSSWGIGLSYDSFYIGRVAKTQTTNALTQSWIFDNEGYITSEGYKKKNSSDLYVLLGGGGHKLETNLSVGSAAKLTTPVTITIGSQSQNFDGSSNITFNLSDINSGAYWDLTYSPTSVQFSGDWVRMPLDLSSFVSGTYLLTIEDSAAYYTGVFMFSSGTINTDEEILLHACGTRDIYGEGVSEKQGILYAKIKPYNNKAALWLAYSHQVTKSGISIKIKKLATL